MLLYALGTLLKLLHPFVPHVTEKLWGSIDFEGYLMIQEYPQALDLP
ncbi:MAG: class I tRNA ligase family protein [bacterium]|nr:class I tRNA ligase family protein [bacterium]